VSELRRTI